MFLAGSAGEREIVGAPTLDLTDTVNTSLANHLSGLKSLSFFAGSLQYAIRDGRGDGELSESCSSHFNQLTLFNISYGSITNQLPVNRYYCYCNIQPILVNDLANN